METLGDHIRKRRLDLKLGKREAGQRMGVGTATLSYWELGKREPQLSYIRHILEFLGYDPRPPMPTTTLAERLVAYRYKYGITHKQLAEILDVDACTISKWERNRHTPPEAYLNLILAQICNPNPLRIASSDGACEPRSETRFEYPNIIRADDNGRLPLARDDLGHQLIAYRLKHGLSRTNLGAILAVERATISRWERKVVQPSKLLRSRIQALLESESPTDTPANEGDTGDAT